MQNNANIFHLRPFTSQDAPFIIAWPQSLTEARWWAGTHMSWPLPIDTMRHWHDDPEVHPYMLTKGATLLGYGELWLDAVEREVELARLIVAPAQRGQGVGVALVQLLLKQARSTPYPRTFLRVFPDNHVAIACYRRVGFTPVSLTEQETFNRGQSVEYVWVRYALG